MTIFLTTGNYWQKQKFWPGDSSQLGIAAFYEADSLPKSFNSSSGLQSDSVILMAFNKGWYRLPVYDNALSEYLVTNREYITVYPSDTLIYYADGCPCGGMPVAGNPNDWRFYILVMYQTHYYICGADTIPKDTAIKLKLFVKPTTSNLIP